VRNIFKVASAILTLASAAFAGVTVSSPSAGSSVGSPVHFVASATSSVAITTMKIYVDNNVAYSVNASKLDTNLSMSTGSHYVVVQSWDKNGTVARSGLNINVTSTTSGDTGGGTIPSTAKVFSGIEQMSGWQWCSVCAGPGGNGTAVPFSMTSGVSSPSMDGASTKYWIGGSSPYGAALWWKQLGADDSKHNFVYDLYFYMTDPKSSQALEFDMNQAVGGKRYIFGTQCDYKDHKTWDVFDGVARKWVSTGIACTPPSAYTWHHLVLEFQRTSGNMAKFIAVTLDGKKSYFNKSFAPHSSSVRELNVAFQMDGNGSMTDYSVWVDKMKMSTW
jgi:hypothetical protein